MKLKKDHIYWFPLLVFLFIFAKFSITTLGIVVNFSKHAILHDWIIALLTFLSTSTVGIITIYTYYEENPFLTLLLLTGTIFLSFFLGLFEPTWFILLVASITGVIIILYGLRKGKYVTSSKLKNNMKIITLAVIIAIMINPIGTLLLKQTSIQVSTQDGKVTPRFYLRADNLQTFKHYTTETLSTEVLESLSANEAELFLAITRKDLKENSESSKVIQKLNEQDIPVHAWLLESQENGYWANDYNFKNFESLYEDVKNWEKQENLHIKTIQLDSETLIESSPTDFFKESEKKSIFQYLTILKNHYKNGPGKKAEKNYENLVNKINETHKSSVAVYPFIIDDQLDGDTTLQDLFGVSSYPPKNWDEILPMVYRIGFYRVLNLDLGSYLVYSYSHSYKSYFGETASIGLARPDALEYKKNYKEMARDALILESLGYDEATIFSINLFLQTHGEEKLKSYLENLNKESEEEIRIPYRPLVSYARISTCLADRLI